MSITSSLRLVLFVLIILGGGAFSGASALHAQQQSPTKATDAANTVRVVVNEIQPFAFMREDGTAAGLWVSQISNLLEASGVEFRIEITPWSRAYSEATTRENVLVAHLDRLPSREEKFHWLYQLDTQPFHLVARKDSHYFGMTLQEAAASDGRAVCIQNSSQCDILRGLGFPDERIWEVADFTGEPLATLVWHNRAQFWLDEPKWMISRPLEKFGMKPGDFVSLGIAQQVATYLAASKNFNAVLLAKVQNGIAEFNSRPHVAAKENSVFVATTETRPYFYKASDKLVAGEWISPIENYLAASGIKAVVYIAPWTRVLHEAKVNDDVLIANLDRTPQREDQYAWLLPLKTKENHLIAVKGGAYDGMNREQAIASGGIAMCLVRSSDCDTLRALGFREENIAEMRDFHSYPLGKMLLTGRVAFTIGDLEVSSAELKAFGLDPQQLSALFKVNEVVSYLAAPKHLNPQLMERLRPVSHDR